MASNKVAERGTPLQVSVPAAASVKSNDALLIGKLAAVANEADGDATRPSRGKVSVDLEGCFNLSVVAKTSLSPSSTSAVYPGDPIYADGGTTDTNTGVTYGFTLDKNSSSGVLFGSAVSVTGETGPLIAAGSTATIAVRLKGQAL